MATTHREVEIALQPVRVETGSEDEAGQLVFADGRLVALLVQLRSPGHGADCGRWFCETGYGPCSPPPRRIFDRPEEAVRWVQKRVRAPRWLASARRRSAERLPEPHDGGSDSASTPRDG
jgi:hypothetical protein